MGRPVQPRHLPKGPARDIAAKALEQGWSIELRNNGHLCWLPPVKEFGPVYSAATPSDHRSWRNMLARLRQRGLDA